MPRTALVLGAHHQTLAIVRSLGRGGFRVLVGRDAVAHPVERSRYCSEVWPHPAQDSPAFGPALARFLEQRHDIGCVFPVGEASCVAVHPTVAMIARPVVFAMVPQALFDACRDKCRANELATLAGLAVPPWEVVTDHDALHHAIARLGTPVIVKPLGAATRVLGRKAWLLGSREEAAQHFAVWPSGTDRLLVQRYVDGGREGCDFVARDGELTGYFVGEAARTDMPDGTGFAVDFRAMPFAADLLEACRAFARSTRYTGPGLIQFIRDRDGRLWFLENNPRLSAGIAQTVFCGQDLPLRAIEACDPDAHVRPYDPVTSPYDDHNFTHWLYRDLEGFINHRHMLTAAERRAWLAAMLRALVRADDHMTWDWRDPLPVLLLYAQLARRIASGLVRRPGEEALTRPGDTST